MEVEEVSFKFLGEITDGFSDERKLGEGAFGVVYKGVTKNGEDVAVKKLKLQDANIDYKQFQNEFYNLRKLKHQNIVQVLGYCYEIEKVPFIMHDGSMIHVDEIYAALCFEYLHNGSLQKHLSDEFSGLQWHKRFKIIKGICDGLMYIHEELEEPMYHLDLKPDNILLDKDMVPKIADFGLSRIYGKGLTWTTKNLYGTCGYRPPEYIDNGEISGKFDIFSLGVIMIRIMLGTKAYPKCLDMPWDEFVDQVQKNWRNRLNSSCGSDSLLEAYCHQIVTCTHIALNCVEKDSEKRPNILKITQKLHEIETNIGKEGCCKTISRITTPNNKVEMRKEPNDFIGGINLMTGTTCNDLDFVNARETSSDVVEEHIVGRTEEKEKLMASLLEGMSKKIAIIPIYGIGGIGKTTLARLIYNHPKFKCYYHVWVYVSHIFDLNKIRESIILQLSEKGCQGNEREMTNSCLARTLSGKNILIVLDDLWEDNQFQLQELKDMLYHDDSNIIILATTRSEHIAERLCTNLKPYQILPLTDHMCWDIIKQRSGFEARNDKEKLAGLGVEIAKKCGGVALVALSLGYTLQSMNFEQWVEVKDSDIWKEPISKNGYLQNHVLASLKLSYSYMDPCLKPCFTYCAIFPKGHAIYKNDLIYQWISLDFIKPTKLLSKMQLCEKYIVQLRRLSFLQKKMSSMTGEIHHEDETQFTMHDLVHDLAQLVMVDEILDANKHSNSVGDRIHFELLDDCSKSLKAPTHTPTKIRGLRFLESDKTGATGMYVSFLVRGKIGFHDDIIWSAKFLRVLDLSECSIWYLPGSIGSLKQLRYLNAPNIQHRVIPNSITKLLKLIYLRLCGSSISALPKSIGELEGLMYLDLSGCNKIKKLPVSFGKLENLVHLDLSGCLELTHISESLVNLTNLEYLNLRIYSKSRIKKLPEALSRLTNLKYLILSCLDKEDLIQNEGTKNLRSLVYLDISNCYLVDAFLGTLGSNTKLQYLNLSCCSWIRAATKLDVALLSETRGNFNELRYLNASDCLNSQGEDNEAFFNFLKSINNLPNLEHIDLSDNDSLTSVPDCFASLLKLHTLNLANCCDLTSLPANLCGMDSLKFLDLTGCDKINISEQCKINKSLLIVPHFLVQADCHDSNSNLVLLRDVNCDQLMISRLENVKSVQEGHCIKLMKKDRMEKLELNWTKGADRFVEDMEVLGELVPPRYLNELWIDGYSSRRFPEWFLGIDSHLPFLAYITLSNMPMCNSLPPLGQLPNLRELVLEQMNGILEICWDICGSRMRPPFPRLTHFFLREMESLQVWYTTSSGGEDNLNEFMFPNLGDLHISDCANLILEPSPQIVNLQWDKSGIAGCVISSWGKGACFAPVTALHLVSCKVPIHQWRLIHHHVELTIEECIDLGSSAGTTRPLFQQPNWSGQLAPSVKKLKIYRCPNLNDLTERIGSFTSLVELNISNCDCITSLPESIGYLTSLINLRIISCSGIKYLPDNISGLTSLVELDIRSCYHITSLPENIGSLTSLVKLYISHCYDITSLPESIGCLFSLVELDIRHCNSITSLPESIGDLTSLTGLHIGDCYGITSLPEKIGGLTSLVKLNMINCNGIISLPERIGELTSLVELYIINSNRITSLPESMEHLAKLEILYIDWCQQLEKWCQAKENKTKLAHIKRMISDPTNKLSGVWLLFFPNFSFPQRS